ncbi:hypothetical protein D046_3551, partial [Vibrio parahaemolyticus V-223/04]
MAASNVSFHPTNGCLGRFLI